MSTGSGLEIERKYLIRYPDADVLSRQPGCERWDITQTYLTDGEGKQTRRVRKLVINGETRYIRTFKRHVSALTSAEDEAVIDRDAYEALLRERDESRSPIVKTRYRIPYKGHVIEIDIYPFWQDRAILEVELEREDEAAELPKYIRVIRDVSGEKAYKNRQLAKRVPMEPI